MKNFKKLLLLSALALNVLSAKDSFAIAAAIRARQAAEQAVIQQRQRENYEDELMIRVENMVDTKIENALEPIIRRLSNIDERLSNIDERLSNIDERLSNIDERLTSVNGRLTNIEQRDDTIEKKSNTMLYVTGGAIGAAVVGGGIYLINLYRK